MTALTRTSVGKMHQPPAQASRFGLTLDDFVPQVTTALENRTKRRGRDRPDGYSFGLDYTPIAQIMKLLAALQTREFHDCSSADVALH